MKRKPAITVKRVQKALKVLADTPGFALFTGALHLHVNIVDADAARDMRFSVTNRTKLPKRKS